MLNSIYEKIKSNVSIIVVVLEIILGSAIIYKVPYTEIDWVAYMQQVEIFLGGERDYSKIIGQTGPLVYPAGHVYLFTALYYITGNGSNILLAQIIFLGIYIAQLIVVLKIYSIVIKIKKNYWWIVFLLMLSKRVHSIYMLRWFNDWFAMLFAYIAIYNLLRGRNKVSVLWFGAAISVKMNVLLFIPGIYLILSRSEGIFKGTLYLILIVAMQVLIGFPFIIYYPESYLNKAFEFKREFLFKWSVNWNYLGESIATNKSFAILLLLLHLGFLLYFLFFKWSFVTKIFKDIGLGWKYQALPQKKLINPEYILNVLFIWNFIGIWFARSLHYQFYSWYFHSIPWLLVCWEIYPSIIKIGIFLIIEVCWNMFPPSFKWSLALSVMHLLILIGLVFKGREGVIEIVKINNDKKDAKTKSKKRINSS